MNTVQKISELRGRIVSALTPLINNDYIYIDLPYQTNIGDTLIWQGTETFLRSLPYKCLYRCSLQTFTKQKIDKNVVILMHGGGNLGVLYADHNKFRKRIIEEYPNNRIIILPQTVYYAGLRLLANDPVIMRKHKDLYICARDQYSYNFLKLYRFGKNILLVPDMAFCIDINKLKLHVLPEIDRVLFLNRIDLERVSTTPVIPELDSNRLDIKDWIGYEEDAADFLNLKKLIVNKQFEAANQYAIETYLPERIIDGVKMISPYKKVYSNRLHGAILSFLLDKEVTIIDNSYGKNSHYYDTWLKDVPTIHIQRVKHHWSVKRFIRISIAWIISQLEIKTINSY